MRLKQQILLAKDSLSWILVWKSLFLTSMYSSHFLFHFFHDTIHNVRTPFLFVLYSLCNNQKWRKENNEEKNIFSHHYINTKKWKDNNEEKFGIQGRVFLITMKDINCQLFHFLLKKKFKKSVSMVWKGRRWWWWWCGAKLKTQR